MLFIIFICFIILLSIVSDACVNWLLNEYVCMHVLQQWVEYTAFCERQIFRLKWLQQT